MSRALYWSLGLSAAVFDGLGVLYLRRQCYWTAAAEISCAAVMAVFSVGCLPAKVYTSFAAVSTLVAVVVSSDKVRWVAFAAPLCLIVVGTVLTAYLCRNERDVTSTSLSPWAYILMSLFPALASPLAVLAYRCTHASVMPLWQRLVLIACDACVATLNLVFLEEMLRCEEWVLGFAIVALGGVNLFYSGASLRVNKVTLHAPVYLVLWLVGGVALDSGMTDVSVGMAAVPAVLLLVGVTLIVHYDNAQ